MLKLSKQPITIYNASQSDLEPVRRFVVPVTNPDVDLTAIARRVWELANATGSRVQFIGLCEDARQELGLRRTLATISAMVNDGNVFAESEIVSGRGWINSLQSRLLEGDTVVCWGKEHADLLHVNLDIPVYLIPESNQRNKLRSNWLSRATAWFGSIAIIVAFFFLQVEFDHLTKTWTILLQLLSVAGEFWSILSWNNLFG